MRVSQNLLALLREQNADAANANEYALYSQLLDARAAVPPGLSLGAEFQIYASVISIRPTATRAPTEQNAKDDVMAGYPNAI